jgi:hypothetical protein
LKANGRRALLIHVALVNAAGRFVPRSAAINWFADAKGARIESE